MDEDPLDSVLDNDPDPLVGSPLPGAPLPGTPTRSKQRNVVLWSFLALFLAVLAVVAALLLRRQGGGEEKQAKRAVGVQPVGEPDEKAAPTVVAQQSTEVDPRVATHLERARKYMRAGNWRSALFFLDQVLILNPTNDEAQELMSKAERRMSAAGHAVRPRPRRRVKKPKVKAVAAKPEPSTEADVAILSKPNATVYLDGVLLGKSPLRDVSLAEGKHVLKVTEDGHKPYVKEIEIKGGQKRTFDIQLQPEDTASGKETTTSNTPDPGASAKDKGPAPNPKRRPR